MTKPARPPRRRWLATALGFNPRHLCIGLHWHTGRLFTRPLTSQPSQTALPLPEPAVRWLDIVVNPLPIIEIRIHIWWQDANANLNQESVRRLVTRD